MVKFVTSNGPLKLWGPHANDVLTWYSSSAMPQLGALEIAKIFPSIANETAAWARGLLDKVFAPNAAAGLTGAPWPHWCDENGVPPAVYIAADRGSEADRAVVAAYANQSLNWPRLGKVEGAGMLPDGAVARSTGGGWRVPLPRDNMTVITWPDDTFMCTATLSHAAPFLGGDMAPALLDEAARRLLAVYKSGQTDPVDGLLWHGYDAASGQHSCCKWGDGNGWTFMAMADAIKGYQLANCTTSPLYKPLVMAFTAIAEAWVRAQQPSGLWNQLMDTPSSYQTSSASGFGLYALVTGRQLKVLDGDNITTTIARGWQALKNQVQPDGSVSNLSPGFGILGDKEKYLVRSNSSLLWGYGAVLRACAAVGSSEVS